MLSNPDTCGRNLIYGSLDFTPSFSTPQDLRPTPPVQAVLPSNLSRPRSPYSPYSFSSSWISSTRSASIPPPGFSGCSPICYHAQRLVPRGDPPTTLKSSTPDDASSSVLLVVVEKSKAKLNEYRARVTNSLKLAERQLDGGNISLHPKVYPRLVEGVHLIQSLSKVGSI